MNNINYYNRRQTLSIKAVWIAPITCAAIMAGTENSLFSYFALVLSIAAIFFLSEEDSLCLMVFIMPFANIFKSAPGAQSFFTYLMIVYVLYSLMHKQRKNFLFLFSFLLLLFFVVLQMYSNADVLRMIKLLVFVLFIFVALDVQTKDDNKKIFLFYVLGIIISSLAVSLNILPNLGNYILTNELGKAYENTVRFAGMYSDPNYYTVNIILALCLVVVLNHKKQLSTVLTGIFAIALVSFAIMTYSKSALLMLALPILLLLHSRLKRKNILVFFALAIAGAVLIFSVFSGKIEAFDIVFSRFGDSTSADDVTTGRYSLWMSYMEHLSNIGVHTFFGAGLGAELIDGHAAHNTYIDLLYYLGLVGTALLLCAIFTAARQKTPPKKKNLLNYSGWLCVVPLYFFLSELFYFDWPFHILMALMVYRTEIKPAVKT